MPNELVPNTFSRTGESQVVGLNIHAIPKAIKARQRRPTPFFETLCQQPLSRRHLPKRSALWAFWARTVCCPSVALAVDPVDETVVSPDLSPGTLRHKAVLELHVVGNDVVVGAAHAVITCRWCLPPRTIHSRHSLHSTPPFTSTVSFRHGAGQLRHTSGSVSAR